MKPVKHTALKHMLHKFFYAINFQYNHFVYYPS